MPLILKIALLGVLSYLLGAVPFGLIVGRCVKGIDIRKAGSGNIGATNVTRLIGRSWGIFVFILDFLKGFLSVVGVFVFAGCQNPYLYTTVILVSLLAIAGHNWPVFLRFRGGKGVSTSIGVITALSLYFVFLRVPVVIGVSGWVLVFFLSRIVGLASISAAGMFAVSCFLLSGIPVQFQALSVLIAVFIIVRHRSNISSLLSNSGRK